MKNTQILYFRKANQLLGSLLAFFRKIRQWLHKENRISKDLLYAIGEIVLDMIGILLALQVNTSNKGRKPGVIKKEYPTWLYTDLIKDL